MPDIATKFFAPLPPKVPTSATFSNNSCLDNELKGSTSKSKGSSSTSQVLPSSGNLILEVLDLSQHEYETQRRDLAKKYNVRPAYLDGLRKEANPSRTAGREIDLNPPEPWEETINGDSLLSGLVVHMRRFLVAPDYAIESMALWIVLTYLIDTASCLPLLVFYSATKRCGKTTALEIVSRLALKALPSSTISAAALFRVVEKYCPTLIMDEADTAFKENEDLRTLINASFTRTAAYAIRCSGDDQEPRVFSTWCPKALGLIGRLPSTIADRSILIPMRRKKQDEVIERLRADVDQDFSDLKRCIIRWVKDNVDIIRRLDPQIPAELNDRQADSWRELFKIADIGGGNWPRIAREAAIEICAQAEDDEEDTKTMLLKDLKFLFSSDPSRTAFTSESIVEYLLALEERPWAVFSNGKGISKNTLAKQLKSFGIQPAQLKVAGKNVRSYRLTDFTEVFERYLKKEQEGLFTTKSYNGKEIGENQKGSSSTCEVLPATKSGELEIF